MTSSEHGKRHQLPQTGAPGGKSCFLNTLGEVFKEKFAKRKSDCLFLSGVINLSSKRKGNGQFPCQLLEDRGHGYTLPYLPEGSVSHILLPAVLFVWPFKENKEEVQVKLCLARQTKSNTVRDGAKPSPQLFFPCWWMPLWGVGLNSAAAASWLSHSSLSQAEAPH